MRRLQSEYVLKGIYLGLLLFVAVQEPDWLRIGLVALCTFGGLAAALAVAAVGKLRQGYRVHGRLLPFILFLLLESPTLVYLGVLGGTALGAFLVAKQPTGDESDWLLLKMVGGGVALGLVLGLLRDVQKRSARLWLCLLLAAGLVAGALFLFGYDAQLFGQRVTIDGLIELKHTDLFGAQILLGIPVFYLLTFAGYEEESEVEVGVLCAALGVGLVMVSQRFTISQSIPFVLPFVLYFFYTWRVLPRLRVFKHTLRGISYARVGRLRQALLAFRRALQLDPNNTLANEGMWGVHRSLDPVQLANDPETLELVDFDLCIERAATLLIQPAPSAAKLDETDRLLTLVSTRRPDMLPKVDYWRAVAYTHCRQFDHAVASLERVLDPAVYGPENAPRRAVLLQAWQLALTLHDELRRRVGQPQLAIPGRRMEAIGAVERQLADNPEDPDAWNLKRLLYHDLTEAEYVQAAGDRSAAPDFDYGYVQQLGLALINDPVRWQRGGEYLRMAAHGLPATGPTIFIQIAKAHERAGNVEGVWQNYELAKRAGRSAGPKNLTEEDRHAYFATVKMLGEAAQARGDIDAAIENFRLYTDYERSGIETARTLAQLYQDRGDPLMALHFTELGLVFNGKDPDLLKRKDDYYYSVLPEDFKARKDAFGGGFDLDYCLRKAKSLLDQRDADLEIIDWAQNLIELALIAKPDSTRAQVLLARAKLRRGERDEAVAQLEQVRLNKPEKFASGDDEEAWYLACQLLGRLYLDELGKPELAVQCFSDFRKSSKSGADTIYRQGQAYEQLGDRARALKCYELVTAYDSHPLAYDARQAISRLKAS